MQSLIFLVFSSNFLFPWQFNSHANIKFPFLPTIWSNCLLYLLRVVAPSPVVAVLRGWGGVLINIDVFFFIENCRHGFIKTSYLYSLQKPAYEVEMEIARCVANISLLKVIQRWKPSQVEVLCWVQVLESLLRQVKLSDLAHDLGPRTQPVVGVGSKQQSHGEKWSCVTLA